MTPAPADIAAALAWLWDPDGDPLETFDRVAEEFRRDTGHLRPGKSYPMECTPSEEEQKAVRAAWATWCADRQRAVLVTLRAALAPTPAPAAPSDPWTAYAPGAREMSMERGRAARSEGKPRTVLMATQQATLPLLAFLAGWDIEDARLARVADEDGKVDAGTGERVTSEQAGRYARRRGDPREPEAGFDAARWSTGWDAEAAPPRAEDEDDGALDAAGEMGGAS